MEKLTFRHACDNKQLVVYRWCLHAEILPVGENALPVGEAIVRGMYASFDDVLYAFTAAYEYSGNVMPFSAPVSISLPLIGEEFAAFDLVRIDVTLDAETNERIEIRTPVEYTFENGILTFETNTAALYLLLPR